MINELLITQVLDYHKLQGTGVYAIRNKTNSKFYIGSTVSSFYNRLHIHRHELRKGGHCNRYLQNSWKKYGEEQFEYIVIEYCSKEECVSREQYWLDRTSCYIREVGYNVNKLSTSSLGVKRSPEVRKKLSEAMKIPGVHQKLIEASKTPEALAKRRASLKGKCGKTEEHKRKLSKALIGRKVPAEIVEKTASKLRGKKRSLSEETLKRMSSSKIGNTYGKANKGFVRYAAGEETKRKMSESAKKAWLLRKARNVCDSN